MTFPSGIIQDAWQRRRGLCANRGKGLVFSNRDRVGYGARHPHHRKPVHEDNGDTLQNYAILCVNELEHYRCNVGHSGLGWRYYSPIADSELPSLYAGERISKAVYPYTLKFSHAP